VSFFSGIKISNRLPPHILELKIRSKD